MKNRNQEFVCSLVTNYDNNTITLTYCLLRETCKERNVHDERQIAMIDIARITGNTTVQSSRTGDMYSNKHVM